MAAVIESTILLKPTVTGGSREDLEAGDVVTLQAVDLSNSTYSWSMAYKPEGSAATFAGDVTTPGPITFTVDLEGPYLIRLITDLGQATQNEQFVRLRFPTTLGSLKLVAGGEQLNSTVPVPVDIDAQGWADDQNRNLLTLLGFIKPLVSDAPMLVVDPGDGGDYSTIQEAIDAAVTAGAGFGNPYIVLVRPGIYVEDVTFKPHVHVIGWPGNIAGSEDMDVVIVRSATLSAHEVATTVGTDDSVLAYLTLQNTFASTEPTLHKTGPGDFRLYRCHVDQQGISPTQGPALGITAGSATVEGCHINASPGGAADRPAYEQRNATTVSMINCQVVGPTAMSLNDNLNVLTGTSLQARDCRIVSSGGVGAAAIFTDASDLTLEYCRIESAVTNTIQAHSGAAVFAGDVGVTLRWCFVSGDVYFDTTGLAGTSTLNLGAVQYNSLTFPGGTPTVLTATIKSTSLFYDNSATAPDISSENVQGAIDDLFAYAAAVRTLDDAYDGGVPNTGSGRAITADQGAVQITHAASPSDPPDPSNPDGQLQVTGNIQSGAIGAPEIDLDPNPYGGGPLITLGQSVVANNSPTVVGDAIILGNSTGDPLYRNYNLRVGTKSSDGGTQIGDLILQAGDGLSNGGSTPTAGSIFIHAGSGLDPATGAAGDVWLIPGDSQSGPAGGVRLVRPQDATASTLTAAGAFVGGVTGTVRFATNMGAIEVDIDAGDGLAAVLAKLNATKQVTAVDSGGGVIQLTTEAVGPNASIYFLNADAGLDAALGVFDGQPMVPGAFPSFIDMRVSAANEITFGINAANPMIYNAVTGKLTVPGLIDPIGLVLDNTVPIVADPGKGVIFVGDGTGGTVLGDFYFRYENGALENISSAVGSAGTIQAQDEGSGLGAFSTFNFVGPGVTASDAGGGVLQVLIAGGGGGGLDVQDEGGALGTFVTMDFRGNFVQATDQGGGLVRVTVADPTIEGQEEGAGLGQFSTLNFVGGGVTASDAGGGVLQVSVATSGVKVSRETIPAGSFVFGGGVSTYTLPNTLDTNADLIGILELFRNGVADMTRTAGAPTTANEWRITGGTTLQIGADITTSGHTYRVVYPNT